MLHIPSQDRSALMATPKNDFKLRRNEGRIDLVLQKRISKNMTTVEKLNTLARHVGSYMVILPKALVVVIQVPRNPMLI